VAHFATMKPASLLLASLFAAHISSVMAAETRAGSARTGTATALRGPPDGLPVALARLDPGWWKATAAPTSAAPPKATAGKAAPSKKAPAGGVAAIAKATPINQLVDLLHGNEAGVQKLEKELVGIHSRLLNAESNDVAAAGNVSLARSGMYKLAAKAKDEADELHSLQFRSSMTGSLLDNMENQLQNSKKRVESAAKSANATAEIADKTASQKALKSQETLNDKIWKLMDPSNNNSLDATEKRMRVMEKDTDKFKGQLADKVKTVMVSKMRRTVHRLRKAIHRLGSAGNRASEKGGLGQD